MTLMTTSKTRSDVFGDRRSLASCWKASASASLFWLAVFSLPRAIAIIQPGEWEVYEARLYLIHLASSTVWVRKLHIRECKKGHMNIGRHTYFTLKHYIVYGLSSSIFHICCTESGNNLCLNMCMH